MEARKRAALGSGGRNPAVQLSARLSLPGGAHAEVADLGEEVFGEVFRFNELQEGALGVGGGDDHAGVKLVSVFEGDPGGAAIPDDDLFDRGIDADFHPQGAGGVGDGGRHAAGLVFGKAPGAEGAVNFAHVVVEQDVGGAGRARAEKGADDAAGRFRPFEGVGLEPVIEQVGGGLGNQSGEGVEVFFAQTGGVAGGLPQAEQVAGGERGRVGRDEGQQRFDGHRHAYHQAGVVIVGVGIARGVAVEFAAGVVMVGLGGQVIAVRQGCRCWAGAGFSGRAGAAPVRG